MCPPSDDRYSGRAQGEGKLLTESDTPRRSRAKLLRRLIQREWTTDESDDLCTSRKCSVVVVDRAASQSPHGSSVHAGTPDRPE